MKFILPLHILCAFALSNPASAGEAPKPNIVFIFSDDWGWGDLGCRGHPYLKTLEGGAHHFARAAKECLVRLDRRHVCLDLRTAQRRTAKNVVLQCDQRGDKNGFVGHFNQL